MTVLPASTSAPSSTPLVLNFAVGTGQPVPPRPKTEDLAAGRGRGLDFFVQRTHVEDDEVFVRALAADPELRVLGRDPAGGGAAGTAVGLPGRPFFQVEAVDQVVTGFAFGRVRLFDLLLPVEHRAVRRDRDFGTLGERRDLFLNQAEGPFLGRRGGGEAGYFVDFGEARRQFPGLRVAGAFFVFAAGHHVGLAGRADRHRDPDFRGGAHFVGGVDEFGAERAARGDPLQDRVFGSRFVFRHHLDFVGDRVNGNRAWPEENFRPGRQRQ